MSGSVWKVVLKGGSTMNIAYATADVLPSGTLRVRSKAGRNVSRELLIAPGEWTSASTETFTLGPGKVHTGLVDALMYAEAKASIAIDRDSDVQTISLPEGER